MSITGLLEELRKEQKTRKPSCTPCNIAIDDATTRFKNLLDHIEIEREMHRNRTYLMKMKDGIIYTIDDIQAKIYSDKCWIEENFNRYQKCCIEGILPKIEKFKC